MRNLLMSLLLSLSFSVLVTSSVALAGSDAKPFVLGGDPAKGETTYKTLCIACHGEKGAGDGAASAALSPKPANFADVKHAAEVTDEYVYKMVKEGGAANGKSPLMVAWGAVIGDDAKIRDVAAYVRAFSKPAKGAKPVPAPAPKKAK